MKKKLFIYAAIVVLLLVGVAALWLFNKDDVESYTLYAANWFDVNDTGTNMVNGFADENCRRVEGVQIEDFTLSGEKIKLEGKLSGKNFSVEGDFCSVSENGCVYVFDAEERSGNWRVVFCAFEKDIENSMLYFKSDEILKKHNTVVKLYLVPLHDADFDYCIVEIFDVNDPNISQSAIDKLPPSHEDKQWWYVKEFKPVSSTAP